MKVVLIGSSGVGKSALLTRLKSDTFHTTPDALNLGINLEYVPIRPRVLNGKETMINVWDSGCMERYTPVLYGFSNYAAAMVACFQCDNLKTLKTLCYLIDSQTNKNVPIYFTVTKCDLNPQWKVDQSVVEELRERYGERFHGPFYTCAKNGLGVEWVFSTLADHHIRDKLEQDVVPPPPPSDKITLGIVDETIGKIKTKCFS